MMNLIRTKIVVIWLLNLLFGLLLGYAWQYRLLWLALFILLMPFIALIKPRLPAPSRRISLLFLLGLALWLLSVFLHVLYPFSASVLMTTKIVSALLAVPVLCYMACAHYCAWSAQGGNA